QTEARGDLTAKATLLQIADGGRRRLEAALIICLRGIKNLLMPRDVCLAALRGGALSGAAVFFGNHHSDGRGKTAHRLGETGPGVLHKKRNGTAMRAATKAMIELLGGTDSKGGTFFVMKWT